MRSIQRVAAAMALVFCFSGPASAAAPPVSDGEALVQYAAEYMSYRSDIYEMFGTYYTAGSASEKDTAQLALQNALVVVVDHFEGLDVRPCFEDFAAVVLEEWNTLIRFFEEVQKHPSVANGLLNYWGSIFPMGAVPDAIVACA